MSLLRVRPWREARCAWLVVVLLGMLRPVLRPGINQPQSVWNFDKGFVRNIEDQRYQE